MIIMKKIILITFLLILKHAAIFCMEKEIVTFEFSDGATVQTSRDNVNKFDFLPKIAMSASTVPIDKSAPLTPVSLKQIFDHAQQSENKLLKQLKKTDIQTLCNCANVAESLSAQQSLLKKYYQAIAKNLQTPEELEKFKKGHEYEINPDMSLMIAQQSWQFKQHLIYQNILKCFKYNNKQIKTSTSFRDILINRGFHLLVRHANNNEILYDMKNLTPLKTFKNVTNVIFGVDQIITKHPNDKYSTSNTLKIRDIKTLKTLKKIENVSIFHPEHFDGHHLITITEHVEDNKITATLYDMKTLKPLKTFENIRYAYFSIIGPPHLFVQPTIDSATLYDMKTLNPLKTFENMSHCIFSNGNSHLLANYTNNTATLYDMKTLNPLKTFENMSHCIFSNGNSYLLAEDTNNTATLYDMKTLKPLETFDTLSSISISSDNSHIVALSSDQMVIDIWKIFNPEFDKALNTLDHQQAQLIEVIHQDKSLILSPPLKTIFNNLPPIIQSTIQATN